MLSTFYQYHTGDLIRSDKSQTKLKTRQRQVKIGSKAEVHFFLAGIRIDVLLQDFSDGNVDEYWIQKQD